MGTRQLEQYHSLVSGIVESFPEPRRSAVKRMLDGPIGEQFMTAPASTRRSYHNSFPCGLVAHSLNVATNAVKLADALAPSRWHRGTVLFCALFHDLGKAGSPGSPYYVPTTEDWKRRREECYEVSRRDWMPNAELGLWTLSNAGVTLSHEEYAAIRLNDGPGAPENRPWDFRVPHLALVIQWADHWSMEQEKARAA